MTQEDYATLWPGGLPAVSTFEAAPRPASLDGLVVAFVWDYVFRGDEIFPILQEALSKAYPKARFVAYDTFGSTFGGEEHRVVAELPGRLSRNDVDVAVSGVGCYGACTPAVMRASAAIERAGIPTASLVCEGFAAQAHAISPGLGCAALPLAVLKGHVDSLDATELREMVLAHTLPEVTRCLTDVPKAAGQSARSFAPREIVARGSLSDINATYLDEGWSDGLPIVPPTLAAVEAFLRHTPDAPDRLIGAVQPSGAGVTSWNVAVNGVMAGCAPDYMPILVAIAEIMADPAYGVEHSGDTTGGDPLIVLNGPIIGELGFNHENGALRDGCRPNGTVGRFLRLFLRNVAGFRPGGGDKSTFGHAARVVLAEHEAELEKLGWDSFSVRRGFDANANVVTVGRFTGDTVVGSMYGREPEGLARYLADGLVRQCGWELIFAAGFAPDTHRPLVAISPMIAKTLAKSGVNQKGLQQMLFDRARIPAWKFEQYIGAFTNLVPGRRTLKDLAAEGLASAQFAESDDPERLVPIVERPEDILVVVSGDPYRSNAIVFGSNGMHGFPTSREIRQA
ncbi:MAG: UGSC family (seleno)protein [Alphaproteobacteria bacterium]